MDSKHKLLAICFTVLCVAGYFGGKAHLDNGVQSEQERTKIELEKEKTKQIELMLKSHALLEPIKSNIEKGVKAVIRGASDAEEITIASVVYTSEDIAAINAQTIRLKLNATKSGDNIKSATIEEIVISA